MRKLLCGCIRQALRRFGESEVDYNCLGFFWSNSPLHGFVLVYSRDAASGIAAAVLGVLLLAKTRSGRGAVPVSKVSKTSFKGQAQGKVAQDAHEGGRPGRQKNRPSTERNAPLPRARLTPIPCAQPQCRSLNPIDAAPLPPAARRRPAISFYIPIRIINNIYYNDLTLSPAHSAKEVTQYNLYAPRCGTVRPDRAAVV